MSDASSRITALREAIFDEDWRLVWQLADPAFTAHHPEVKDYLREHMGQGWSELRDTPDTFHPLISAPFCNHEPDTPRYDTEEVFDFRGMDFSGKSVNRKHVSGSDFRSVILDGADFPSETELRGACFAKASMIESRFESCNFDGADLRGADLKGAHLRSCSFRGADLRGALLKEANLRYAKIEGADLRGANLANAALHGACFDEKTQWPKTTLGGYADALTAGADRSCAKLARAEFFDIDLRGIDLSFSDLTEATFNFVNLSKADLRWANLYGAEFFFSVDVTGTDFRGANLREADLSELRGLTPGQLAGARYSHGTRWPSGVDPTHIGALGPGAQLEGADLRGEYGLHEVDLEGANLRGAVLEQCDLRASFLLGADFTNASLTSASLQGATLGDTTFDEANLQETIIHAEFEDAASFRRADLQRAFFGSTEPEWAPLLDFSGADLRGVTFYDLNLENAVFNGALYDDTTKWPEGFDLDRYPRMKYVKGDRNEG